jgi:aldehyde:ferredoxin oxidoreductase
MVERTVGGYTGKMLRVDLGSGQMEDVTFDEPILRKWVGGSGLGAKILYDEVRPRVQWNDPENRLILTAGPLSGTRVMGSGTFTVVTVGPLTGGATTSQANGFLAAYMKFAGFDGVVLQGRSEDWVYLYLHDGVAELRDASRLLGLDTWEMQAAIARELGKKENTISVFGVGPAGEHQVRFAAIAGDHGHVAGHNGTGAVMGSKRVKAIVAARGPRGFAVDNDAKLADAAKTLVEAVLEHPVGRQFYRWGTSQNIVGAERGGWLPTKNLTTNVFPEAKEFSGELYRPAFNAKRAPCWACRTTHLHTLTVPSGPYAGFVGDEPEYEQWAAWGSGIGNSDAAGVIVLSNDVDRLGLENNETQWVIGWVMECYERGILTKEDTGGLEMTWGNVEAARAMLRKIANREGIGDLLADGVRSASEKLGRGSEEFAVYTMKGNSPRGHDHRARWIEMLETCVSDTGTISVGALVSPEEQGAPARLESFNPEQIAETLGKHAGRMVFEDCLGTCRFATRAGMDHLANTLAAATGWDFTAKEAIDVGRRTINLLRVFNLQRGLTPELEYPSKRYGSTPMDGPVAGKSIAPFWEQMRADYYKWLGWDLESGRPLRETLTALGLSEEAAKLWG